MAVETAMTMTAEAEAEAEAVASSTDNNCSGCHTIPLLNYLLSFIDSSTSNHVLVTSQHTIPLNHKIVIP